MKRKNIIITGASSGLGEGMAIEFAKMGCNLALCARRMENMEAIRERIIKTNPNIKIFLRELDVNNHDQVFEVFKQFKEDFASLGEKTDRIIVNAGMGKGASLGTGFFKQNMMTAQTNFTAALAQFEAAMEIFREQNSGHLVAISSVSAFRGFKGAANVYAATKAGLSSLTEGLQVDVMKTPIRVSAIHPGYIQTDIIKKVKKVPFVISLEKGSKLLVKAIEKEPLDVCVPAWPWTVLRRIFPWMSLKMLRKMGG